MDICEAAVRPSLTGAWLADCTARLVLRLAAPLLLASRRRADRFLGTLSVFRSGRFAFCHDAAGFVIRRSAPSGAGADRFMELRGA